MSEDTTVTFPPPGFIATESALEGIEIYQPAPADETTAHREVVHFTCPQCGGGTAFSAAEGGLTCTNCNYYEPPQQPVVGKNAEQFEFTVETLQQSSAHGWGEARKELQCQSCGAYTTIGTESLTHTCPFCSSNKVIQHQAPQDLLRPRFIIPFKLEVDDCHPIAREWLGSSWMTPGSLKNMARVANFNGIYLPFWTFDSTTAAGWKAEVGHTKTERYYSNGKWRTRTKTVWKWESGRVKLGHNDLVIPGSSRISHILLKQIRDYNLHQLAMYEPKFLAGFQAQGYDIPLEKSWETARHEMREKTRQACRDQASTSKIRNFSMEMSFSDEAWRYVLLPIYLAVYKYEDKTFQVMVNGQSGDIAGQRPVAWWKIWLAVAALLTPGLLLGIVGVIGAVLTGIGIVLLVPAFILLGVGLAFSFHLVKSAMVMDDA